MADETGAQRAALDRLAISYGRLMVSQSGDNLHAIAEREHNGVSYALCSLTIDPDGKVTRA